MKNAFFAFIIALVPGLAHAQDNSTAVNTSTYELEDTNITDAALDGDSTSIQFKAGFGFGTLGSSPSGGSASGVSGMNFGLQADMPVGEASSSFNTGLNFVQKGASFGGTNAVINYLVLPVLMKANFGRVDGIRANVGIGPYAALKLNARTNTGSVSSNLNGIKDLELGGRLTTGVEIPMDGQYSILVGADYDIGLSSIINSNNVNADLRTRTLLTTVGLGIRL